MTNWKEKKIWTFFGIRLLFVASAAAFFCLWLELLKEHFIALMIACAAVFCLACKLPSTFFQSKGKNKGIQALALLTAAGICWDGQVTFYETWGRPPIAGRLPFDSNITWFVGLFGAIVGIFFLYSCLLFFYEKLKEIVDDAQLFRGIKNWEWVTYGLLCLFNILLMILFFMRSDISYGTAFDYDLIYTSDSPFLVKDRVYITYNHPENDLRQPLFAVFSAPFTGIAYLIGKILGNSAMLQTILVNVLQIALLYSAHLILANMLKLSPVKRCCFMTLTACTYTNMLFTVMMEQYIVAYFWLVLSMCLVSERKHLNRMPLWGTAGTLLTGMALMPFASDHSPIKNMKAWFADMLRCGIGFIVLMLAFCRVEIFFGLPRRISRLISFTGSKIGFADKIYQYSAFIHNCFTAPDAGVQMMAEGNYSWKMNAVTGIDVVGIVLLVLAVISVVWNREKRSSLLAGMWVAFSVVMLLLLGWGTKENGLILYSLYFGWAFLVLLFQLAEKVEKKLKVSFLVPVASVCCITVMLVRNIPQIIELVRFAIACYPL